MDSPDFHTATANGGFKTVVPKKKPKLQDRIKRYLKTLFNARSNKPTTFEPKQLVKLPPHDQYFRFLDLPRGMAAILRVFNYASNGDRNPEYGL